MKQQIRDEMLKKRNELDSSKAKEKSSEIIKKVCLLKEFKESKVIHCYISNGKEVETLNFIKGICNNKKIVVPYFVNNCLESSIFKESDQLKKGNFDFLEPSKPENFPKKDINLIIIPGIAFDKKGNRIGYGKGCYDKFLDQIPAKKIALAYDFQIVDNIPEEEHDVKVDCIITEDRVIRC